MVRHKRTLDICSFCGEEKYIWMYKFSKQYCSSCSRIQKSIEAADIDVLYKMVKINYENKLQSFNHRKLPKSVNKKTMFSASDTIPLKGSNYVSKRFKTPINTSEEAK